MPSFTFNPTAYGPAIAALLVPEPFPKLGPGSPNLAVKASLQALQASPLCRTGLWLLHDFLDESHTISQDLESAEGCFWHAIMHRREPDSSNSKYWWRRVGPHPVLDQLRTLAPEWGYAYSTPNALVEFCEVVRGQGGIEENLAQRVQLLEWQLLFEWCFMKSQRPG